MIKMDRYKVMSQSIIEKYRLDEVKELLTTIESQVLPIIKQEKLWGRGDDIELLVPALTKSMTMLRGICVLCENGFPDSALILARNIYEQRTICAYILNNDDAHHEELLNKYFEDYELKRAKYIFKQSKRYGDIDNYKDAEELIEKYKEKYGKKLAEYWWADNKPFSQITEKVMEVDDMHKGLYNNMHTEYELACLATHASCFGNRMNIGTTHHGIDMRARNTGHEEALFLAISSLIPLVGCTYECLRVDVTFVLEQLNKLAILYLKMLLKQTNTD